ncbi:hypothetical protein [Pseudogulbenkiania subflava]|uniref:hypothetical protein n=1 Tax=Pseudogulbenkiania subflava TaxID=451637 RepID=UPI00117BD8C2|nr:hypothetical protein [Pseudogulbenkiania subflava]
MTLYFQLLSVSAWYRAPSAASRGGVSGGFRGRLWRDGGGGSKFSLSSCVMLLKSALVLHRNNAQKDCFAPTSQAHIKARKPESRACGACLPYFEDCAGSSPASGKAGGTAPWLFQGQAAQRRRWRGDGPALRGQILPAHRGIVRPWPCRHGGGAFSLRCIRQSPAATAK